MTNNNTGQDGNDKLFSKFFADPNDWPCHTLYIKRFETELDDHRIVVEEASNKKTIAKQNRETAKHQFELAQKMFIEQHTLAMEAARDWSIQYEKLAAMEKRMEELSTNGRIKEIQEQIRIHDESCKKKREELCDKLNELTGRGWGAL